MLRASEDAERIFHALKAIHVAEMQIRQHATDLGLVVSKVEIFKSGTEEVMVRVLLHKQRIFLNCDGVRNSATGYASFGAPVFAMLDGAAAYLTARRLAA